MMESPIRLIYGPVLMTSLAESLHIIVICHSPEGFTEGIDVNSLD